MKKNEKDSLLEYIDELKKITNSEWVKNLSTRKIKELEFHDRDRDQSFVEEVKKNSDTFEKFYGNRKFYTITERSTQYMQNWVKTNSKNKIFLDYACGNGGLAIKAAKNGAKLSLGLDISKFQFKMPENLRLKITFKMLSFFKLMLRILNCLITL